MARGRCFLSSQRSNWCAAGSTSQESVCDIHDASARERHKGILIMVILDLQPWNIVNDPGFLYYSNQLDPHYKVASDKFYVAYWTSPIERVLRGLRKKR